jgi:predicted nucleic acid-binding protein
VIVVSDTSPLNYLLLIGTIDILPALFPDVYVPPKVMEELLRPATPQPVKQWAQAPPAWLKVVAPTTFLASASKLDPGEAHAIALAKELHAAAILIDERKGRRIAKQEGLTTFGTITLLELAAQKKLIDLKPTLEALQETTFRISPEHIRTALEADAARKLAEKSRQQP